MENYTQLCVWPGITVGIENIDDFEKTMLEELNVRVKYEIEVITNPDLDENGQPIPETGGRNDLFFYVHNDDVIPFAITRLNLGIRWWEDVVSYNDGAYLYTKEILDKYTITW